MSNPFLQGAAPGRARPEDLRPGSFKKGHKKLGGRKRGTPNLFSADYKKALLEAAYRVGNDGNGKDGVLGYLRWVGQRHPSVFYTVLFCSLLAFDGVESEVADKSGRTTEDLNNSFRDYIGIRDKSPTKSQIVRDDSPITSGLQGPGFPCGSLMQLAVERPRLFAKLFVAAFLRPPTKRRATTTPRVEVGRMC